jgi:hypothetical protein
VRVVLGRLGASIVVEILRHCESRPRSAEANSNILLQQVIDLIYLPRRNLHTLCAILSPPNCS